MVSSVLLHTFVVCPKVPLRDLSTSSYTWVARSRSESTPQFTALALNKPSSSSSSSSSSATTTAESTLAGQQLAHVGMRP